MYEREARQPETDNTIGEAAERTARARGLVVRWPTGNELFIDIDSSSQHRSFLRAYLSFLSVVPNARWCCTPSPSGAEGRSHVVVTLPFEVDASERVFLQALLCSDPVREYLARQRVKRGLTDVSFFYERPA